MKVNSVRGPIPDTARPVSGPGVKSQTDIVNKKMPQEGFVESAYTKEDLPGLNMTLTGRSSDKDKTRNFIHNSLRMRPLIQEWTWQKSKDIDSSKIRWQRVCSSKEVKSLSLLTLSEMAADALSGTENAVAVTISLESGINVGLSEQKLSEDAMLFIKYKKGNT